MPNDLYYDLSAAANLQNNYVKDLSTIYNEKTDNAADVAVQLNNLQSAISELSSQYDKANSSSDSVLHHQQEMMNILQVEQQRLLAKKELFDQVEAENDRKVLLNTTYRKKYTQYTKITIVVIMVLIAIVIIRMMGKYVTIFPESLYSFLMIVVISIGIIYVLILYSDLSARSNIDYDQIEIPAPKLDASGNLVVNSPAGRSIWGMFDTCKGSKCCSVGTNWNDQLSLCVVQPYNQGSSLTGSAATVTPRASPAPSPGPSATPSPAPKVSVAKIAVKEVDGATKEATGATKEATGVAKAADAAPSPGPSATPSPAPEVSVAKIAVKEVGGATKEATGATKEATGVAKAADAAAKVAGVAVVAFTTMAQAVEYGDINQNRMILSSNMQTTSSWMGDMSMAKPNAYLEYNHFQRI